jgi:hypothetical protein
VGSLRAKLRLSELHICPNILFLRCSGAAWRLHSTFTRPPGQREQNVICRQLTSIIVYTQLPVTWMGELVYLHGK